jgi:type IV pilus assembly protein PilA
MIVVVIVGILAILAVVGYRKLVQSSHVSEATGMVQNIRVAQEAYHSETQQYANISSSMPTGGSPATGGLYPAMPVYGTVTAWGLPCTVCATGMDWSLLPLHIDGPVLFGYATMAGPGNSSPSIPITINGGALTLPSPATTDWYVIGEEADLDNNPAANTDVFGTSWTNQLFISNEGQ